MNAVNEVTRERAQSCLTDEHIERIVGAYRTFKEEPGFTRVGTLDESRAKEGNLSIPLYVSANEARQDRTEYQAEALPEALHAWRESSKQMRLALAQLLEGTTRTRQP